MRRCELRRKVFKRFLHARCSCQIWWDLHQRALSFFLTFMFDPSSFSVQPKGSTGRRFVTISEAPWRRVLLYHDTVTAYNVWADAWGRLFWWKMAGGPTLIAMGLALERFLKRLFLFLKRLFLFLETTFSSWTHVRMWSKGFYLATAAKVTPGVSALPSGLGSCVWVSFMVATRANRRSFKPYRILG